MTAKTANPSGRKRPISRLLLAFFALLALIIVTAAAAFIQNRIGLLRESRQKDPDMSLPMADTYRNQGLPPGKKLEAYPYKVTEEHVFFLDRILERYPAQEDSSSEAAALLTRIYSQIPSGVGRHFMAVPLRIAFEEGMQVYDSGQQEAYAAITTALSRDVSIPDIWGEMEEHKEEYVYFRTEDTWTSLGAYYGAVAFARSAGGSMPGIKDYEEHLYISFQGSLVDDSGSLGLAEEYYDRLYFYLNPDGANTQLLYQREGEAVMQRKTPTIAKSRGELTSFVGGIFSHSIIQGDRPGGGTLVLAGDTNANILVPWMAALYEEIYLINQRYYLGGAEAFRRIFQEHDVRDVLIVEGMDTMADDDSLSWLRKLAPE